jgi:ribonucleoside-diphosphate reductase alpha chain
MKLPFDSDKARLINKEIFENMYFAAIEASCELAVDQRPYSTFQGSPASLGNLQYDLWKTTPSTTYLDWTNLKKKIQIYGLRNSLSIAVMPTASTAQILGNTESIEPMTSNIYLRRVLAGEFAVINKFLVKDLIHLGLWSENMKNRIVAANGSIVDIPEIPENVKNLYKTVWEISQRTLIDYSADRAPFVCQSQSLNLYMANPSPASISSMHMYAFKKGLKTGMYYLRTRPAADAIKTTIDPSMVSNQKKITECVSCSA